MADIISNAVKFGSIVMDPKYVKTWDQIQHMGDATEYPTIFPMWCTTDDTLYIFCKTDDGNVVASLQSLVATTDKAVWYPIIDSSNKITWEARVLSTDAPQPVTLTGLDGKSAYQIWLEQGHSGTEQDFLNSLVPDLTHLNNIQIAALREQLGINDLENALVNINQALADIIG